MLFSCSVITLSSPCIKFLCSKIFLVSSWACFFLSLRTVFRSVMVLSCCMRSSLRSLHRDFCYWYLALLSRSSFSTVSLSDLNFSPWASSPLRASSTIYRMCSEFYRFILLISSIKPMISLRRQSILILWARCFSLRTAVCFSAISC